MEIGIRSGRPVPVGVIPRLVGRAGQKIDQNSHFLVKYFLGTNLYNV